MDKFFDILFSVPKYFITIALCVLCMIFGASFLAEIIDEFVSRW